MPALHLQQNFSEYPQHVAASTTGVAAAVRQPSETKPMVPLPEKFFYLQTVVDVLRKQSIVSPKSKRKRPDAAMRLDQLYDLLRKNRPSQSTISQLNQIAQLIQIENHANAIDFHTQIASRTDFTTIAISLLLKTFMPIKSKKKR